MTDKISTFRIRAFENPEVVEWGHRLLGFAGENGLLNNHLMAAGLRRAVDEPSRFKYSAVLRREFVKLHNIVAGFNPTLAVSAQLFPQVGLFRAFDCHGHGAQGEGGLFTRFPSVLSSTDAKIDDARNIIRDEGLSGTIVGKSLEEMIAVLEDLKGSHISRYEKAREIIANIELRLNSILNIFEGDYSYLKNYPRSVIRRFVEKQKVEDPTNKDTIKLVRLLRITKAQISLFERLGENYNDHDLAFDTHIQSALAVCEEMGKYFRAARIAVLPPGARREDTVREMEEVGPVACLRMFLDLARKRKAPSKLITGLRRRLGLAEMAGKIRDMARCQMDELEGELRETLAEAQILMDDIAWGTLAHQQIMKDADPSSDVPQNLFQQLSNSAAILLKAVKQAEAIQNVFQNTDNAATASVILLRAAYLARMSDNKKYLGKVQTELMRDVFRKPRQDADAHFRPTDLEDISRASKLIVAAKRQRKNIYLELGIKDDEPFISILTPAVLGRLSGNHGGHDDTTIHLPLRPEWLAAYEASRSFADSILITAPGEDAMIAFVASAMLMAKPGKMITVFDHVDTNPLTGFLNNLGIRHTVELLKSGDFHPPNSRLAGRKVWMSNILMPDSPFGKGGVRYNTIKDEPVIPERRGFRVIQGGSDTSSMRNGAVIAGAQNLFNLRVPCSVFRVKP